jgi:hypothetical protein
MHSLSSLKVVLFAKKLQGLFLCDFSSLSCEKTTLRKNSRVGLCNPPFGFLCLTFHEMAAFARTTRHGDGT